MHFGYSSFIWTLAKAIMIDNFGPLYNETFSWNSNEEKKNTFEKKFRIKENSYNGIADVDILLYMFYTKFLYTLCI